MQVNPLIFVLAPFLGFAIIGIYRLGIREWSEKIPTFFSIVFGTISTLLFSLMLAGIFSRPRMDGIPYEVIIPVVFLTATVLVSFDLSVTNNRVIDSVLVTLFVLAAFTFAIIGFFFFLKNGFPWKALITRSSVVIFVFRIVTWVKEK